MPSVLSRLSAAAKAHHESVNDAYETFYSGGVSPRQSIEQSRATSTSSNASMTKAWKGIKNAAKEHNDSVNAAYESYYGVTPRPSFERETSVESVSEESSAKKMWAGVKRHAKEHHRSINAAYGIYYSGGQTWESK